MGAVQQGAPVDFRFRPSIIWALDFEDGRAVACDEDDLARAPATGEFRWFHVSLADHLTQRWIRDAEEVPQALRQMLLSSDTHQRAIVDGGFVGCVLHDVERDFDKLDAERTGVLRLALGPQLMITARHHPVRSADIMRTHIERDHVPVRDAACALDLAVSAIVENIAGVAARQAEQIEAFEDELLDHSSGSITAA